MSSFGSFPIILNEFAKIKPTEREWYVVFERRDLINKTCRILWAFWDGVSFTEEFGFDTDITNKVIFWLLVYRPIETPLTFTDKRLDVEYNDILQTIDNFNILKHLLK